MVLYENVIVLDQRFIIENNYNISKIITHNDITVCEVMVTDREMTIKTHDELSVGGFVTTYFIKLTYPTHFSQYLKVINREKLV